MKRINLGYFIKEGFLSIFSHGLMSFAAICMIVACLIIMGSFSLLAVNVDENLTQLANKNEFFAYFAEDFTQVQVALRIVAAESLVSLDGDSVKFVTRAAA